ncbi:helix-turn-helix domain-containing protein [Bifidobacterium cuniculi]|uniref:helix-turn-helix domain-containing protein n=4 Tax=Bifidobacterium cuniculi TaxID=1688 RepID=UPI0012E0A236|nr:helix-turn-helix domain-containing protein [Bifidobacterium cuniculi]
MYRREVREQALVLFEYGFKYGAVSSKLGIGQGVARAWQDLYEACGKEALLDMGSTHRSYAYETKLEAVRRLEAGESPRQVMAGLHIASRSVLARWRAAWKQGGDDALRAKPRGRPRGSVNKPVEPTREQQLERRVLELECKLAVLEKARALRDSRG